MVKWNGPFRSDRSNREKRSTSKGGPLFSKFFRLDLTDPFSFRPKFPEILVEWIAPIVKWSKNFNIGLREVTFGTHLRKHLRLLVGYCETSVTGSHARVSKR